MKAKQLKEFLAGIPDDWDVAASDVDGKGINFVGFDKANPVAYLTTAEEFPESWYDEYGIEVNYEKNVLSGIKLCIDMVEHDDIYLHDPDTFGDGREFCVRMEFRDGIATGQSVVLTYPKLADLTKEQLYEINEYTDGKLTDANAVTPYDVALKFGKVSAFGIMDGTNGHNPALVKQLNVRWMEDKQMFKDILCALYHRDVEEIRDSDTYNWGDKSIDDICRYMYEHWANEASNYLQHIADDQDLETIIKYVRYDRSEH